MTYARPTFSWAKAEFESSSMAFLNSSIASSYCQYCRKPIERIRVRNNRFELVFLFSQFSTNFHPVANYPSYSTITDWQSRILIVGTSYVKITFSTLTSRPGVSSAGFLLEVSIATYSSAHFVHANLDIIPQGLLFAFLVSHWWLSSTDWISEALRGFTPDGFVHNSKPLSLDWIRNDFNRSPKKYRDPTRLFIAIRIS